MDFCHLNFGGILYFAQINFGKDINSMYLGIRRADFENRKIEHIALIELP